MSNDERPPCKFCGTRTRKRNHICIDCADDIALTDGDWVIDTTTRVLRWEPRYWAS